MWTKKIITAVCVSGLVLLGGCTDKPSEEEVKNVLSSRMDGPSCLSSIMFEKFPATPPAGNESPFDALVDAGLLTKQDRAYSLTSSGSSAYSEAEKGFCYSQGFEVSQIKEIEEYKGEMGAAVNKAWTVTAEIRQKPVAEWAKTEAIKALADRHITALSETPKRYVVIVGTLKTKDGLQLLDPSFSISRGFSAPMGW